jgi:DNA-binding transcriptional LysR family regulator
MSVSSVSALVIAGFAADMNAAIISDSEPLALSAVYPQHRQASRPVQVLVEFLRERLDEANGVL